MTLFHPTTPGLAVLEVTYGTGAVIIRFGDHSTVLHPDVADEFGTEVRAAAERARRALQRTIRAIPPLEGP